MLKIAQRLPPRHKRLLGALLLALATGYTGYATGLDQTLRSTTLRAPEPGTVRVVYSLEHGQADKEIIALIDAADRSIYFAVYTFTLEEVAEALARAKERGVEVRGIVDRGQAGEKFSQPVTEILARAQIPVVTETHPGGSGIMHLKMLVTDGAYAIGSYNWTRSATTVNDEIIEIGTDPALRQVYEDLLKRLFEKYSGSPLQVDRPASAGTISYTDAPKHVGKTASVRGRVVEVYTAASGTTFLNFCADYKTCPFSAVVFASDAKAFGDLSQYKNQEVTITGKIVSYQGRVEIVLDTPSQIAR